MIFFSHSSRIRILQLTFALVCSCSVGLLTTEKHHLVPFCLLSFCILCLSIQIKYFVLLDTQGTELKNVFHLLRLFTDRTDPLFRFLIRSYTPTCFYRHPRRRPWGGLGNGGGGGRGVLITSWRSTLILRFTSHETSIYVFTLLRNRGRAKCQKRYVSPTL